MNAELRTVKNLAHRGFSGRAPENTLAAFRLAEEAGADGFEFDVQVTADGVPVVIHDEFVDRTTNGTGLVNRLTYAQLRQLDAGSWFGAAFAGEPIPTLEEVIATFPSMYLNIELKNAYLEMPQLEEKVIALVRRYAAESRVLLSSFDHASMQKVKQLAPDIATGLLYDCRIVNAVSYAQSLGANALHPFFATVTSELVAEAHANGMQVNVWTVNDVPYMQRVLARGVDAIISNYPDQVKQLLG